MYISRLSLTNYRNYHSLDMEIPQGLLVFHGGNAQGKTNLLEAVYLLSIAKAYRANTDREALGKAAENGDGTQILGVAHRGQERVRIMVDMRLEGAGGEGGQAHIRKDIRVNGIPRLASELVGVVNAVLFDAEDIQLVLGPPATRRRYLDILICQLDRSYLRALQQYQKVVYQRNHLIRLIRERKAQLGEMDFWDQALVQHGAYITMRRHEVVRELKALAKELHGHLTDAQEELDADYLPSIPLEGVERDDIERAFRAALEAGWDRDMALGSSQWGPHRDDLRLVLGGLEAATYASRGQARTLAVTLKLTEGALLARERGESPILLLDDVLSELDVSRRQRLLEHISQSQQAFVSTTDLDRIGEPFLSQAIKYLVTNGTVEQLRAPV